MYGSDACACVSVIDTQALRVKYLGISRFLVSQTDTPSYSVSQIFVNNITLGAT